MHGAAREGGGEVRRILLVALVLGACSHQPNASSPPKEEVADGEHLTSFQLSALLGHYSTQDGRTGFVLDRTVEPPLARLDGDEKVRKLTRRGSVDGAFELISDDKAIWLRIEEESGTVLLFQGPQETEGVGVVRDADAERLE
jgi:hypothetical protein